MSHETFRNASEQLQLWANELPGAIENDLSQSLGVLERGDHLDNISPEQMAELILRDSSKRVEDVMGSFDALLESINMPPRYTFFFKFLELSGARQKQVAKLLNLEDSAGEP